MMGCVYLIPQIIVLCWFPFASAIMVSYGTNHGSITPLYKPRVSDQTRKPVSQRGPAPVYESPDDVPNPSTYKPLVPLQYRTKIPTFESRENSVSNQKYNNEIITKKYNGILRSFGPEYSGPQLFDNQLYELLDSRKYTKHVDYYQEPYKYKNLHQKHQTYSNIYVPQIGVIYRGGIKYYVPQVNYNSNYESDENSVYDRSDFQNQQQRHPYVT